MSALPEDKKRWFADAVEQGMAYLVIVTSRRTYRTEPRMFRTEEQMRACVDKKEGRTSEWVLDEVYNLAKGIARMGGPELVRDDLVIA